MAFIDDPYEEFTRAGVREWRFPPAPAALTWAPSCLLNWETPPAVRSRQQLPVLQWLYSTLRLNIKRGPVYRVDEALSIGKADCLAYSKLFTILGRRLGLEVGVVDVLIDAGGRNSPHTALLVRLQGGMVRIVDLWYGTTNIRHRRLGLRLKEGRRWEVRDIDLKDINDREVTYLPDRCVDGITFYVMANSRLAGREYEQAIRWYGRALSRYPNMVRPHYNRAIAYEQTGRTDKARADYIAAMQDENSLIRVIAREYAEITALMRLDEAGIDEAGQEIYLLHSGIITGRAVSTASIARRMRLSEAEVVERLAEITRKLGVT